MAWLEASVEIGQQLLSLPRGVGPVAQDIIEHVRQLGQAQTVTFVGPSSIDDGDFEVRLVTGAGAANLLGNTYAKLDTLEGRAMQENRGLLSTAQESYCHHLHADSEEPAGPLLAVPFSGPEDAHGAIVASRGRGAAAFSDAELAMAEDFARQCGIALKIAGAQADGEQLRFREQREVEVRQLHDDLIQQLFGLGVTLETLRGATAPAGDATPVPDSVDLWQRATGQIDTVIQQLRSTLTGSPGVGS